MEITLSLNEGLAREFKIAINASDIKARVDAKLNEISKQVKMPGFRPGKVPISVVKARYGEQSKGEVIQAMLDEAARQAIESNDLNLASQPSLDITAYEDGSDLEAKLKCEILPQIELPDISALSIERPTLPIDEAEVSETMQRLASENSPTVEAKKGYQAALGDVVVIDFEGSIKGVPFDGGAAQDHALELGSNSFIPGFEDGLVGVKAGDKTNINVPFPEDYQAAHLAGKLSVFAVTVKEVRTKGEPLLDDALAKKLGFEKLPALEEAVRSQLSSQHQPALRQMLKKNILDQLNEQADFDVPPTLLSSEYDVVARSMKSEQGIENNDDHGHDHGHDHDHKHAADEGLDEASKEEAKVIATRRVRLGLMLTEIGRSNNIKVSEEDTKRAIFEQAKNYPGQEKQIVEYYQKNPEAAQQLAGPLFEDKVIDYIVELAKVTDFETNMDALYKPEVVGNNNDAKKLAQKAAKKPSAKKAAKAKSVKDKTGSDVAVAKKKPSAKKVAKKAAAKKS
ncbi:MAG: trigger factor [Alphaproteobacteria bacterium]